MMVVCDRHAARCARRVMITLQGRLIAMLALQNADMADQMGELEERLARMARAASPNSGNSSLPPCWMTSPAVSRPRPRPGASRQR